MTCKISFLKELDTEGGCKERSLRCKAMMERDLILIRGKYGKHLPERGRKFRRAKIVTNA